MANINKTPNRRTRTHESGTAARRTPQQELFVLAASFLNEPTFYEAPTKSCKRLAELCDKVCADTQWCLNLVTWLRGDGGLRTSAQLTAVCIVHARLRKHLNGGNRGIIRAACRRADDAPAILAAWSRMYGLNIPMPVKRGVADALGDLNEAAYLKWGGRGAWTIADAIRITHPKPSTKRQEALYRHIVHPDECVDPLLLPVIDGRHQWNSLDRDAKTAIMRGGAARNVIHDAALTHEAIFSDLGAIDTETAGRIWDGLLATMGYQAVLMNLRRIIDSCGERSTTAQAALDRIAHPENAGYSPMPIGLLSAYRNVPPAARPALEQAARHTLAKVPELAGTTLVMVDKSGSMGTTMSERSTMTRYDAACMFASALALKNSGTTVVPFDTSIHDRLRLDGDNPIAMTARFGTPYGGTLVYMSTREAIRRYGPFDRTVIITDEQTGWGDLDVDSAVPAGMPLYVWNMAGYRPSLALGNRARTNLGGLTDSAFAILCADEDIKWPWEAGRDTLAAVRNAVKETVTS